MEMRLVVEPGIKRQLVIVQEAGHLNEWIRNFEITAGGESASHSPNFREYNWVMLLESKGE